LLRELEAWQPVRGPWRVRFDPRWGGPGAITLPALLSWPEHGLDGVRHYAGTAIYTKDIDVPHLSAGPLWIDLGRVEVVATLLVNGHEVDTLWKAPYMAEASRYLRPGRNRLEIRVTNLWANRLIADAGLPADLRVAWTTFNPYKADDKLFPSGLLGPVTLRRLNQRPQRD
jgi:hypothetical protein